MEEEPSDNSSIVGRPREKEDRHEQNIVTSGLCLPPAQLCASRLREKAPFWKRGGKCRQEASVLRRNLFSRRQTLCSCPPASWWARRVFQLFADTLFSGPLTLFLVVVQVFPKLRCVLTRVKGPDPGWLSWGQRDKRAVQQHSLLTVGAWV